MEKAAFLAHVRGIVQGVGFRYFTYREASSLGITGYVKNLSDGQVEVFAEGLREDLQVLLDRLQQGPGAGYVEEVDVEWKSFEDKYHRFSVESSYY
jgi:acylphosphatase